MKKNTKNFICSIIGVLGYWSIGLLSPVKAADPAPIPLGTIGGSGLGPFGNVNYSAGQAGGISALVSVTGAISSIIGLMTIAAVIWFVFQFILGGFGWITSGGDKAKLQEAHQRITNAFIGLLIVVAGWSILALVGIFLGIDTVVSVPKTIIEQLNIKP